MKKLASVALTVILIFSLCLNITSCLNAGYTDTVKFDKRDALVIAHRGLSGLEAENTDAAFIAAGERSYYGVEADVRKTADGHFIICHDESLKRVSGKEIKVEKAPFEALKDVALFDKKGGLSGNLRLATLESYISICKQYQKQCFLELKSDFTEGEILSIIEIISALDYLSQVTFISFDYDNLLYVRKISPSQPAQLLFSKISDELTQRLAGDKIDASINYKALTKEALDTFHSLGLRVGCWTVDNRATAERLASLGVDYITTNILE